MAGKAFLRTLHEYESDSVLPLVSRSPGVYEQELLIRGNSLLATVFVDGADPGATVKVEWWDATTGKDLGEEFILGEHDVLTSGGVSRKTITRIHDKPTLRATVAGGNATFSVYVTVVSAFASDLDSALKLHDTAVQVSRDKGIPIAAWDTSDDNWKFLRTKNGRLQVDVQTVVSPQQPIQRVDTKVITVGTAHVELKLEETRMDGRRIIVFKPRDGDINYGFSLPITTSNSKELLKGQEVQIDIGDIPVYAFSESDVLVEVTEGA